MRSSGFPSGPTVCGSQCHTPPTRGRSWQRLLVWVLLSWDCCTESLNEVLLLKSRAPETEEVFEDLLSDPTGSVEQANTFSCEEQSPKSQVLEILASAQ